jgi:hypothetical protein
MITKPNEKVLARTLYFETDHSHIEIADAIGINRKTLYLWMKEGEWQRLKQAARQAPAIVVDNLFEQLTELNHNILSRPAGSRFPTREEAEVSRKLILSIDKMKKQATLSDNIQVLKNFTTYIQSMDPALAKQVITIADDFIKICAKDGTHPYEMEYPSDNEPEEITPRESVLASEHVPQHSAAPVKEEQQHHPQTVQHQVHQDEMDTVERQENISPYREGIEEIIDPDPHPWYSKTLRVGNITVRFGRHLSGPQANTGS